jgi:hypothetical protein
MLNIKFGEGAAEAGAASRCGYQNDAAPFGPPTECSLTINVLLILKVRDFMFFTFLGGKNT